MKILLRRRYRNSHINSGGDKGILVVLVLRCLATLGWYRLLVHTSVFIPKSDNLLRLYVDYRALNKITTKNRHPLPLINKSINRLSGVRVYTKLDLRDAYHKIRIRKGDE